MPLWDSCPPDLASLLKLTLSVGTGFILQLWQDPQLEKQKRQGSGSVLQSKTGLVEQQVECSLTWDSTFFSFVDGVMLLSSNYFCSRSRNTESKQQHHLKFSSVLFFSCQGKMIRYAPIQNGLQKNLYSVYRGG